MTESIENLLVSWVEEMEDILDDQPYGLTQWSRVPPSKKVAYEQMIMDKYGKMGYAYMGYRTIAGELFLVFVK